MDVGVKLSRNRDFFSFFAPPEALGGPFDPSPHATTAPIVILDLQPRGENERAVRVEKAATRVIPFPHAHRALVRILTSPERGGRRERLEVLLHRRTFDRLADRHGASRINRLDLEGGIGADDTVMRHLGACLEHALSAPEPTMAAAVDQIAASTTVHIAQRYGGLQPPRSPQSGGLAAWQLRVAWDIFDRHLDSSVSLDDLARECRLSVNHFSRAFRRSTGLAPHRWLMRRRVEAAKDLMLAEPMPLAQVAVACGFADQSHFTRTFASLIGLTPARWRINHARDFAFG